MSSGKIPKDSDVEKFFFAEVDKTLEKNPDALIGIHCIHGINRTGYLICRYLIEKRGFQPQEAIDTFEFFIRLTFN